MGAKTVFDTRDSRDSRARTALCRLSHWALLVMLVWLAPGLLRLTAAAQETPQASPEKPVEAMQRMTPVENSGDELETPEPETVEDASPSQDLPYQVELPEFELLPLSVPSRNEGALVSGLPASQPMWACELRGELEPNKRTLSGRVKYEWTGSDEGPEGPLGLELPMNAFKNNHSFWLQEQRLGGNSVSLLHYGFIQIDELIVCGEPIPVERLTMEEGGLVLPLPNPQSPIPPSAWTVEVAFATQLPDLRAGLGMKRDQWIIASGWVPILRRLSGERGEDCGFELEIRPTLTLPAGFELAASQSIQVFDEGDRTDTVSFVPAVRRQFTFVAGKQLQRYSRQISLYPDHGNASSSTRTVQLAVLADPGESAMSATVLDAMALTVQDIWKRLGGFPHSELVACVVEHGIAFPGVEAFPMLVVLDPLPGIGAGTLSHALEIAAAYGTWAQVWQGPSADEDGEWPIRPSLTLFSCMRTVREMYPHLGVAPSRFADTGFTLEAFLGLDSMAPDAWLSLAHRWAQAGVLDGAQSGLFGGLLLMQQEAEMGSQDLDRVLAQFFESNPPQAWTWENLGFALAPDGLTPLWGASDPHREIFDPAVTRVEAFSMPPMRGYVETPEGRRKINDDAQENPQVLSVVEIQNPGGHSVPMEIWVQFEGGERIVEQWGGGRSWNRWSFLRKTGVREVILDPNHQLLLDTHRINNRRRCPPKPADSVPMCSRILVWIQHLLLSL